MSDAYTGGAHSAAPPPPSEAEQRAANNSVGELLSDVTRNLSTLMRQEVALAKAELTESGKNAGKGAGMYAGAAVGGHFVLLFLSLALMWGLDVLMPIGWAAVIVAVIWGIIAAILAAKGKKEMKQIRGLPTTAETIKEIPPTLKPGEQTP
ncbi:phage holin family protein [Arthrobacter sp. MSA 4-2]|uniref:phage holin family protein n=1 Tax=Arthrobacter sp. MSA 4-2 TaxID=2794349 RepID=UPI0018E8BF84|nr:phage holin family protein [Arthrobacter sp. MSA 4-2]MBJ2121740.1 phage holin family protein [Arthrobacter sp. MSA 4-2]